ncbi:ThiF family adenylyltransferase [Atopobium sp. oral taxon 199]|uniref:tRNA threonylcarbamoyladenosine dehydratase n=1 Tax=Atopobium sp. oral taxon 199 TaxID=712156 RepID=UPI00034EB571|nr:tRNA threonylcarbamoyladenosine dehydratase [Atopobium sp. oral taxon 199]EPD77933.1 hypothetical protein HMPREF1527_00235 [Atopobium sp. oral taxon 199 str. F0494]
MAEQIPNATTRLELILGHERLARLQNACVMVLGLGGVGSNCVEALARGGIGHFVLVDADTVEASNLNRQAIAFVHTLGQRKTDATRNLILDINPAAEVITLDAFLLKETVPELLSALPCPNVLVDAIDTVSAKLAAARWAQDAGIYFISSMGGANKIYPELLKVSMLSQTHDDALARIMRKESRKRGLDDFRVVYSPEAARRVFAPEDTNDKDTKSTSVKGTATQLDNRNKTAQLGTMSYIPPIMGQLIASDVILHLTGLNEEGDAHA